MLDAPPSSHYHHSWLPLQPLSSSSDHQHQHGTLLSPLPGNSCSIEALRDTFTPILYAPSTLTPSLSSPSISHATTRDLPAILNLHETTLPISYSPAFFLSLLLNSGYTVLMAKLPCPGTTFTATGKAAKAPAKPTGAAEIIVACATSFWNQQTRQLELLTLCVDPIYTRRGLATSLLQTLANAHLSSSSSLSTKRFPTSSSLPASSFISLPPSSLLTSRRHIIATLRVQTSNTAGIALYTKLGFFIDGIEHNYYRGSSFGATSAYRMKKILSSEEEEEQEQEW